MPRPFPIAPTFPQADWIHDLVLPQAAKQTAQMLSGHSSILRTTKVQFGAVFSAEWWRLSEANLLVWQNFWKLVDTWDTVTLPLGVSPSVTGGFWPTGMGTDLANYYINASPTGYWRMKTPKIERTGLTCQWSMLLEFEGVLD